MSTTKDFVNKKWVDWLLATIISILAIFTTMKTEVFGKFATREYVDGKAYSLQTEQRVINSSINKDIESVRRESEIKIDAVIRLLEKIDQRAERIEDRINQYK